VDVGVKWVGVWLCFKAVEKVEVEKTTTTVRGWKGVNRINKCEVQRL
jgi:hypothetical protein